MEEKEWLKELKVGDRVFVVTEHYSDRSKSLKQVDKITPTGQVVIGNLRFKNGKLPSSDKWSTCSAYLEQATEESILLFRQSIYSKKVLKRLSALKDLTYEDAVKIVELLGRNKLNL